MGLPKKRKILVKVKKTMPVNMGIDFGTSFTKVCFAYGKEYNFVQFQDSLYKPSLVYFDKKKEMFYYQKPPNTDGMEKIEYFKYSMIDKQLPHNMTLLDLIRNKNLEILCSIFFLACVIKESKKFANDYYAKFSVIDSIEWFVTMGVPINNYEDEHLGLYDRVLHLADKLCPFLYNYSISVKELDDFYTKYKSIKLPEHSSLNTLPELYAESLAFLKNDNVTTGVYALVDIGGGTVDMAMIFKEAFKNRNDSFGIASKIVKPLGVEIIANNIIGNPKALDSVKNDLRDKKNLEDVLYVIIKKEIEFKEMCKKTFASIVAQTKKKEIRSKLDAKHILYSNNKTVEVYMCGGGAHHEWYKDSIGQTFGQLKPLLREGLKIKFSAIERLLPDPKENHRLIIAKTLAQPIEYIKPLTGFPWHFPNTIKENVHDDYNSLQEKQREQYGESV